VGPNLLEVDLRAIALPLQDHVVVVREEGGVGDLGGRIFVFDSHLFLDLAGVDHHGVAAKSAEREIVFLGDLHPRAQVPELARVGCLRDLLVVDPLLAPLCLFPPEYVVELHGVVAAHSVCHRLVRLFLQLKCAHFAVV